MLPKTEKNVRVDMIISSVTGFNDVFTCEDKSEIASESTMSTLQRKSYYLAIQTLRYWKTLLPQCKLIEHLEVITGTLRGRELVVRGTRMLPEGGIVMYEKARVSVPAVTGHYAQTARFLLTVISLQVRIPSHVEKDFSDTIFYSATF